MVCVIPPPRLQCDTLFIFFLSLSVGGGWVPGFTSPFSLAARSKITSTNDLGTSAPITLCQLATDSTTIVDCSTIAACTFPISSCQLAINSYIATSTASSICSHQTYTVGGIKTVTFPFRSVPLKTENGIQ